MGFLKGLPKRGFANLGNLELSFLGSSNTPPTIISSLFFWNKSLPKAFKIESSPNALFCFNPIAS